MAPGVAATDRLGDATRCVRIPLIERDGDLVGAEEGAPEVMPGLGNGRQDFTDAALDGVVLPDGHLDLFK